MSQAIGHDPRFPLSKAEATKRFSIEFAIVYLRYQQQKRQIKKLVGYLYEAIVQG